MKARNNDFLMTFYYAGQRVLLLRYVHNTDAAFRWVKNNGILWDKAYLYIRKTRELKGVFDNYNLTMYSLTFVDYNPKRKVLHLPSVPDVRLAIEWALSKGIKFVYVNVYNSHTKIFVERIHL